MHYVGGEVKPEMKYFLRREGEFGTEPSPEVHVVGVNSPDAAR
jgi:hypothetical protein